MNFNLWAVGLVTYLAWLASQIVIGSILDSLAARAEGRLAVSRLTAICAAIEKGSK